jgi:DNA-binding XRE family transcriptional regulator
MVSSAAFNDLLHAFNERIWKAGLSFATSAFARPVSLQTYFIAIDMEKSRRIARGGQDLIQWKSVGRRIRELRGFDINQEGFARRIGVSQGYLSSMERGEKEIGVQILLRISREFGKSIEWLLTGEG